MATGRGGFDYEFVTAPPKALECPVCLLTLRDPHVISCCGNEFCQRCIERVQRDGKPCPLCNEPNFTTFLHKKLVREVNALVIRCPQKEAGCEWEGELGQIQQHLNPEAGRDASKGCSYVMVACSYQCGAEFPRCLIAEHESDACPKRPVEMQIASLLQKFDGVVTENQLLRKELNEVKQKCGELEKKTMRLNNDLVKLTHQYTSLKANTMPLTLPPFYMVVDNFRQLKSADITWFSSSFYSHPGGYKMAVIVSPNGYGVGTGTHMSVSVQLRRGEFDDQLQWPFNGQVTVEIYNRTLSQWSASKTIDLRKQYGEEYVSKPKLFRNTPNGYSNYISHYDLFSYYYSTLGDCVSLRVSGVKLLD